MLGSRQQVVTALADVDVARGGHDQQEGDNENWNETLEKWFSADQPVVGRLREQLGVTGKLSAC